ILLSAGLGGGMVVDGSDYQGATGRAGRIGFLNDGDGKSLQSIAARSALRADRGARDFANIAPTALMTSGPVVLELV
ncbi:hypothetical protein QCD71_25170, partial [Sphingomonas sp. PsM26]|nr:hypothetical protein [Sphingomonas sp. PsM26]